MIDVPSEIERNEAAKRHNKGRLTKDMLPLIPALLLLAMHGPSGLERLNHEGKLPKAIRVLERVLASVELRTVDKKTSLLEGETERALRSLSVIAAHPEFSKALWELFERSFSLADISPATELFQIQDSDVPDSGRMNRALESNRDGYLQSRRTRAGPIE